MLSITKDIRFLRFLIIFTVLAMTGIGGIFDGESLIFAGFPLFDYATFLIIIYYILTFNQRNSNTAILSPTILILILTLLVIVSMPFRGNETILQAFQVGRRFIVLLFAYVIIDDIKEEECSSFILKTLFTLAVYYSILVIFNYLIPGVIASIWKGIGSLDDLKGGVQRHVLKANDGLLFVHIGFVIQFCRVILNKKLRDIKNLIFLFFLFISMFMMGFRAVFMSTIVALFIGLIIVRKELNRDNLLNFTQVVNACTYLVIIFFIADIALGHALSDTIGFAVDELSGASSGTLQGRLDRSLIYQIPMFLKEPFFGVGFVNIKSVMAQDLGYIRDINYNQSLYYFDFGYGTLLVMFGIVGGFIFVGSLFHCIKGCINLLKENTSIYPLSCIIFIVSLLICNYSFGALETTLGLLPLSIIIGLASFEDLYYIEEENILITG